jgi:DNA-binding MarR family transcriptional regulator
LSLDPGAHFEQAARAKVETLGPSIDLDTFAASFNLFRVATRVIGDLEAAVHRPRGLTTAGFRLLFTVWTLGEMQPRELARLAGVSRAAVSGTVSTLANAGLVDKVKHPQDGRMLTVRLTDAGTALLKESYLAQNEQEKARFGQLSPEELRTFAALSRRLMADPDHSVRDRSSGEDCR